MKVWRRTRWFRPICSQHGRKCWPCIWPEVEEYIIQLVMATRNLGYTETISAWLEYGANPRGTISLDRCARAHSWIQGRDFVSPDDVQEILFDVLRHQFCKL